MGNVIKIQESPDNVLISHVVRTILMISFNLMMPLPTSEPVRESTDNYR